MQLQNATEKSTIPSQLISVIQIIGDFMKRYSPFQIGHIVF